MIQAVHNLPRYNPSWERIRRARNRRPASVTVSLPQLHPGQREVLSHPARHKVLVCGRRWGKTRLGVIAGLRSALHGGRVWWVAPTYAISSIAWRLLRFLLAPAGSLVDWREAERCARLFAGGEFWFRSADRPDNLRGEGLDYLIIDEADFIDGDVWTRVLRPALADRRGSVLMISTPNIEGGWFHRLHLDAPTMEGWQTWRFPSWTNPYLPPEEVEQARRELPELDFRREWGAEFVSAAGARIRREWLRYRAPVEGAPRVCGVDLAISTRDGADYTAIVVLERAPDGSLTVVDVARARVTFADALHLIEQVARRAGAEAIAVEDVGYQRAVVEELLRRTSFDVRAIRPHGDKVARFAPVEARYQHGLLFHNRDMPGLNEFEAELLAFPVGEHDDQVDALSLAYHALDAGVGVYL